MTVQETTAPLILFVDDEATAVKYFRQAMEAIAPVAAAGSVEEGKRLLDQYAQTLAVVVSDQRMPGESGNELLHYARLNYPHMVRILTTAYSELERTIEAVNQGQIHRYISKPWEIAALRMEMKQALDLASLRNEHAQLLREKMLVRQEQVAANRIGALYGLCCTFTGPEQFQPLETYLSAAIIAGIHSQEPDWVMMDYADMAGAEARRNGKFGFDLRNRLAEIRQRRQGWQPADGLAPLLEELEGMARLAGDGAALVTGAKDFGEFLGGAAGTPVSARHVSWLALLIWLHERGCALQTAMQDGGMQCRLVAAATASPAGPEEWVRRLNVN